MFSFALHASFFSHLLLNSSPVASLHFLLLMLPLAPLLTTTSRCTAALAILSYFCTFLFFYFLEPTPSNIHRSYSSMSSCSSSIKGPCDVINMFLPFPLWRWFATYVLVLRDNLRTLVLFRHIFEPILYQSYCESSRLQTRLCHPRLALRRRSPPSTPFGSCLFRFCGIRSPTATSPLFDSFGESYPSMLRLPISSLPLLACSPLLLHLLHLVCSLFCFYAAVSCALPSLILLLACSSSSSLLSCSRNFFS